MNNAIKLSVVLWGISTVIIAVFDLAWQYQYGGVWWLISARRSRLIQVSDSD